MHTIRSKWISILSIASVLVVSSAEAFTLAGSNLFKGWSNPTITLTTNFHSCSLTQDKILTALKDAMHLWNSVGSTSLNLSLGGDTTFTSNDFISSTNPDTLPKVMIVCDAQMSATFQTNTSNIPAVTLLRYAGNEIHSALLALNASASDNAQIENLDPTKLAVVFAHELGHVLGLGHSKDATTLMYFNASAKSNLALSQDEVDGVTFLYPRQEFGEDKPFGCGSLSFSENTSGLPPSFPVGFTALFFLFTLIYARMRA